MEEKLIPDCSAHEIYQSLPSHKEKQRLCSPLILRRVTLVLLIPVSIALLTCNLLSMRRMNILERELMTLRHNIENLETEYATSNSASYYDEDDESEEYEPIFTNAMPNDTQSLYRLLNKTTHGRSKRAAGSGQDSGRNKDRQSKYRYPQIIFNI